MTDKNADANSKEITPASITDGTVSALLRLYKQEGELLGRQNEKVAVQVEDAWTSNTEGGWKLTLLASDKEYEDANQDFDNPDYTAGWFGKTAAVIYNSGLSEQLAFRMMDGIDFEAQLELDRFTTFTFKLPAFYDYVLTTVEIFVESGPTYNF